MDKRSELIKEAKKYYKIHGVSPKLSHFRNKYKKYITTWNDILELAEVPISRKKENRSKEKILEITKKHILAGNVVSSCDLERVKELPSKNYYFYNFKTWENVYDILELDKSRLNKKLNKEIIIKFSKETFKKHKKLSFDLLSKDHNLDARSIQKYFGDITTLKKILNYDTSKRENVTHSDEELIKMYKDFSFKKNKKNGATFSDLNNSNEIYNVDVFSTRFGSINMLRKKCGLQYNDSRKYKKEDIVKKLKEVGKVPNRKLKEKTGYSVRTVLAYFQTTSMTTVWEEIEGGIKNGENRK